MLHSRKTCDKETKRSRRSPEKSLDNVISMRISDQEKRKLERLIKSTSKNVSDIMREALDLWSSRRRDLCMD